MKLYECLKEVIEENKIFKLESTNIIGRPRIYIIYRGNLFAWFKDKFSIHATN